MTYLKDIRFSSLHDGFYFISFMALFIHITLNIDRLFALKAILQLTYGLNRVRRHPILTSLTSLEHCLTLRMTRKLCLSMRARSRFVYVLSDTAPMVELMRHRLRKQPTRSFEQFMVNYEEKMCQARVEIRDLDVLRQSHLWTGGSLAVSILIKYDLF